MNNNNIARLALRLGLAFVFLYAGISSLQHPFEWVGYLPGFLTSHFNGVAVVKFFAVYELALTLWLLTGKYVKLAAGLSALTFLGIVLSTPNQFIITFRDIALMAMAVALMFINEAKS